MGPVLAIAGGAVSAVLFLVFGYETWVAIAAGAAWLVALGIAHVGGHRAIFTGTITDLMIVVTATHPSCVGGDGSPRVFSADAGAAP